MENPETIVYAKDLPEDGCGCSQGNDFYNPPVDPNSRPVKVQTTDPQLIIADVSDSTQWKFTVDYLPYTPLAGTISLTPYASGVAKPNPALKGETIDRVDLVWTWSSLITDQVLDSDDPGISHPALDTADRDHSYTGISLEEDTDFTLDGDDGKGLVGSEKQQQIALTFGNYFYYGHGVSLLNTASSGLQAFLGGLNNEIVTERQNEVFATGAANEHFFFAYPKSMGLPSQIKKGLLAGGYIRLKNVSGTLVETVPGGETESDISISNGLASEPYYVFMSTFDNQQDPNIPIEIL